MAIHKTVYHAFALAFLSLFFSNEASATVHSVYTYVYSITAFSPTTSYNDSIDLQGVTSLGTCTTDSANGFVIVRIPKNTGTSAVGDRLYSTALTAYTMGKKLLVYVDDSVTLNGNCEAWYFVLQ